MSSTRILIVEDESVVQLHLRRVVEGLGYEVCGVAASVAEALAVADAQEPDLVLMDIRLRGDGDGVQAARALRERHGVAVVFLTAYADEETVARTRTVGAVGYIVKPFSEGQVRAVLSTAIGEHERVCAVEAREQSWRGVLSGLGDGVVVTDR